MTREKPDIPSAMCQAALFYARRGWPVFPCRERDETLPSKGDGKPPREFKAKAPYTPKGLKDASASPHQIRLWWTRWPEAMIGLPMGVNGCFALDFDPRVDDDGEIYTLERLKAELEAQMGCELPTSLAAVTPSDGVHVYLKQPEGEAIRNRGNLPRHVDVRGAGGYVIAPPSIIHPGTALERRYRFLRGKWDAEVEEAPAALVELLRAPKARPQGASTGSGRPVGAPADVEAGSSGPRQSTTLVGYSDEAVRKYALAALDGELQAVRGAGSGHRNAQLNESALKIASLVAAGALDATVARYSLEAAARENPGCDSDAQLIATIASGWSAGLNNPRDLSEVAAAAKARAARPPRASFPSGASAPRSRAGPARAAAAAPPGGRRDDRGQASGSEAMAGQSSGRGFGDGDEDASAPLSEAETWRLQRIAEAWLKGRLERVDAEAKALTALAWGVGRRISVGLLDEGDATEALWEKFEKVADLQLSDMDRAIADGKARGFDPGPVLADLRCAMRPMTDFGLAERFLERHGDRFLFTTAKGWLGWDERRWKVLDQDKDTLPAPLIAAVFDTIRDVQREARRVAETSLRLQLVDKGKQKELELDDEQVHALDHWVPVGKGWKRFSTMLAAWGRQCEQAGKPAAIANLVRGTPGLSRDRWLTVAIEDFDREKLAINVLNGTLRFDVEEMPDGTRKAAVRRDPHRREDLLTRIAAVEHDPEAACPLYDAMLEWAQPLPQMRRYLHQVAGYAATADTGEQKLWFNYGRGGNGKSTTIDAWCSSLGDYSGTIGIESFLDQGIKKRGDQATPDLARLTGVRMLRASEPERGAKLNAALVKAATGGEPMAVRALHRGFFDLTPQFKLLMSGNSKPDIPDTDEGIWRRMKLIPWLRNIDKPEEWPEEERARWPAKDPKLLDKMKGRELPGVFNRLVAGVADWLENGLVEPDEVATATQAYRDQSDPLARFLSLCTEPDPDGRVKSSELHGVFEAWCKAAGEKAWSAKGFANAMIDKGFAKTRSDGMRWLGLKLVRSEADFVDHEGRVIEQLPDLDAAEPARGTGPPPRPSAAPDDGDDDGLPID